VLEKFLDCGDLHQGFARVRCPDCRLANESLREWMQTALDRTNGQFRLEAGGCRL
jgi:hypothetical protein